MREMNKFTYESPELHIRWFESEDVIAYSDPITDEIPGDNVADDDEW